MTAAAIGLHETYSVLSGAYNVLCGYHDTYSGPYFLSIARIDKVWIFAAHIRPIPVGLCKKPT